MKRKYECLFIVASNVSEEKRGQIISQFSKMAGADATVEKWGMRKFAKPIDFRREGFYVLMNFESNADVPAKMSAKMNLTDGIVRYMFVAKDEKQLSADTQRKTKRTAAANEKPAVPKAETPVAVPAKKPRE